MDIVREKKEKVILPKILKKFHKQKRLGKPLYIEAYKIMACSTEVIKMQFGGGEDAEYSATAYYSCLSEMIKK
jgi:hypothetical protein